MPHRGSSPPLISLPLLIILLPILTLTLLFLAVPPLLSAATNVLQHSPVKTTWNWNWNSFNIILVFVAILFGVFARRNDDESSPQPSPTVPDHSHAFRRVSVSSERAETSGGYESQQWFGFSNDETPNRLPSPVTGVNRLRRNSSSYPDLRQMETDDSRYKFRFFDDFEIEKQFRSPSTATFSTPNHRKHLPEYGIQSEEQLEEQVQVKEIPVDTFQIRPSPVKSSLPPPPASRHRHSQSIHQPVDSRSEITEVEDPEFTRIDSPPPTPTPPRPSVKTRSEQKHGKNERRKSNVKREIAMVWASVLSNQRKRKKKERPRNHHNHHYDNVEDLTNNTTAPPVTPPPPPPLPPPSVFHSIFRKGMGKSKKIHSVHSVPAPPPPPPPSRRSSKPKNQIPQPPLTPPPSRRSSRPQNQIPQPPPTPPRQGSRTKPPLPNKSTSFINDTLNSGNQSPLIPIPPPLPPFKIPAMKFELRGDFVKILSNQSSRCTSPEREHIDGEVSETTTVTNSGMIHNSNASVHVFCPSPDVNAKAATFIARLRGEWRLQKLNSIKEKGNGSLPFARDSIH